MGAASLAARAREHLGVRLVEGAPTWLVSGRDALDLLGRLSTNDLIPLGAGSSVLTLFLSPTGRVLFPVALLPARDGLLAVGEPGIEGLPEWIDRYTFTEDCRLERVEGRALAWLVGPRAPEGAATLAGLRWTGDGRTAERPDGLALCPIELGPLSSIWVSGPAGLVHEAVAEVEADGAALLDPDAWAHFRVQLLVPAVGRELTGEHHPLEAGLRGAVSFTKGCYTGQEVVARQDTYGKTPRCLVRLEIDGPAVAGEALVSEDRAGCVLTTVAPGSSGTGPESAPTLALGYVRRANAKVGAAVRTASGASGRVAAVAGSEAG